jgi:hypothetical protein
MRRAKIRWYNQLQNCWTSERVSKKEKYEFGGRRKWILYEAEGNIHKDPTFMRKARFLQR